MQRSTGKNRSTGWRGDTRESRCTGWKRRIDRTEFGVENGRGVQGKLGEQIEKEFSEESEYRVEGEYKENLEYREEGEYKEKLEYSVKKSKVKSRSTERRGYREESEYRVEQEYRAGIKES